jgi:hypothetical protein
MATFDVAQVTRLGSDLLIVPLHANFHFKSIQEKQATVARLQSAAIDAGLHGIVVPVWASPCGTLASLAQVEYQNVFRSIDLEFVSRNINQEINVWGESWVAIET